MHSSLGRRSHPFTNLYEYVGLWPIRYLLSHLRIRHASHTDVLDLFVFCLSAALFHSSMSLMMSSIHRVCGLQFFVSGLIDLYCDLHSFQCVSPNVIDGSYQIAPYSMVDSFTVHSLLVVSGSLTLRTLLVYFAPTFSIPP